MTNPKSFVRVSSVLLAAVLAWGGLSNAFAAPDSISINFGPHFGAPTGGDLGAVPVNWQYWNNAISTEGIGVNKYNASGDQNQYNKAGTFNNQIDNPEYFTSNLISNTGKDTGLTATWSCNNTYMYKKDSRPSLDNNAILFYGYLDDSSGNQKFNMTAPYFAYDIYYYATTDSNGYRYATINSVNYYGNGVQTVQGTSNWGTLVRGNINQVIEGQHYLKVSSSDSAISVAGVGIDSSSSKHRGSFGALQIVNTYNSQSTITSENSLVLANATWDNDLTGATNQGFSASADGYRIIYTGSAIDTYTVDLNGVTNLPNIKLIGDATNLAFTGTVSQLGKTNTVTDLTKMGETVTIPNLAQVAPQGVVKLGANTTFTEMPTVEGSIPGAYYVDGTTVSFAKVAQDAETGNYVLAPIVPTYQATPTNGMDLYVNVNKMPDDNNDRTLNSLTTEYDYKNSKALTITSGMMTLKTRSDGSSHWVQGGGTITSGYQNADGEYDLYVGGIGSGEDLRINASGIVDNPNGKLNLIKTCEGTVGITGSTGKTTYSGKTVVLEGKLFFGCQIVSSEFYVAHNATLDFSCRSWRSDKYLNYDNVDFVATELTGYGNVIVGNSTTVGSLTLNNVANDGSTFTTVTVEGKYLTLNHSELNAQTVNNSSVINLNDQSTLTAGMINGSATSVVKISADSTLNLGGVAGKVTLEIPANVTKTFSNVVGGPGELVLDGGGTLTLSANNTYSGGTTVKNGTLKLNKTGGTAALNPKSPVTVDGATSVLTGKGDVLGYTAGAIGRLTLQNGGTLNSEGGSHMTVNNVIYMDNGKITGAETGSGSGNYLFDNAFHVTGGTENEISALSIRLRVLDDTPFETGDSAGLFDVAEGAKLTISSVIDSGSTANMTKTGAGELVLTGTSTFNKNVTVNGGVLDLTNGKLYSGAYVSGGNVYVNEGGTLKVNNFGYSEGGASSLGGLTYSSNGSSNIHFNGGTIQIAESFREAINRKIELLENGGTLDLANGVNLVLGANIHGAGGLTLAGAGTMELTYANEYTGGTTVQGGYLKLTNNAVQNNGSMTVAEGATLEFALGENNDKALTYDADSPFTSEGSVLKTGSGNLKIRNDNPGSFAAKSFLVQTGELDFLGHYKGVLEIGSGATFSPGNSIGDLTVDGTFQLDSGAKLLIEQEGNEIDTITATNFIVAGDSIIDIAVDSAVPGVQYTLFTQTSGAFDNDHSADFWTGLLTPESASVWSLLVDGNLVKAYIDGGGGSGVPEPSTWALLALGALGLLYWRKRK